MLCCKFFRFGLPLGTGWTHQYDLRTQRLGCLTLDRRCVSRHHDDRFYAHAPRCVSHALSVIPAGIGDDSAATLLFGKGSNFVVGSAELERADRLEVFGLKIQLAAVLAAASFVKVGLNQLCAHRDASQTRLRFANVVESDDGNVSAIYSLSSCAEVDFASRSSFGVEGPLAASVIAGSSGSLDSRCPSPGEGHASLGMTETYGLNFQDHRHDQRTLLRLLGNITLQVGADFFLDHAVVCLFFVARLFQCLHDDLPRAINKSVFAGEQIRA